MDFKTYQDQSRKTVVYPDKGNNFVYPTLGLVGESGEVAEKIKRVIRDKNGTIDENVKSAIMKELGDVLWYLSQLASELNLSLDEIANENLEKLSSRMERNQIHGEGDDR